MKDLLLALPGGRETQGARYGLTPAYMAYRVGSGPRLLGTRLPQGRRADAGGLRRVRRRGRPGGLLPADFGRVPPEGLSGHCVRL